MVQRCAHRAMHLRYAPQAVRILHARIVIEMRLTNLAIAEQISQVSSNGQLPRMRTRCMNAFVEGDGRAFESFERHCAGNVRESNELLCAMQCKRTDGAHCLRAVEQRQTFFHFQTKRRDLCTLQSIHGGQSLTFVKDFSLADCCQREVSKWREVAARADASLFGNDRRHPFLEHRDQCLDYQRSSAAEP